MIRQGRQHTEVQTQLLPHLQRPPQQRTIAGPSSLMVSLLSTLSTLSILWGCFCGAEPVPTAISKNPELQDPPRTAIDAVEMDKKDENKIEHTREFLSLTIGLEHEIENLEVPEGYKIQGDYENIASAAYDPTSKTLRIMPKDKVGVGTLTIHNKAGRMLYEYRLDIKKSDLDKVARELQSLIGDIEGIRLKIINNKVVVDGEVILPLDMSRIGNALLQFPNQAISMVALSPVARKKIAEIIEREINNPEVSVRVVNDYFILEGIVSDAQAMERAVTIANIYLPAVVVDNANDKTINRRSPKNPVVNLLQTRVTPPPPDKKMVQVVIHYVELSKDYNKMFRFQWMPDLKDGSGMKFGAGGDGTAGVFSQITGIISNLFPKLNWLKSHNFARILETSNIMVESEQSGSLSSQTAVAFPSVSSSGQSKNDNTPVGISAEVTPSVQANSDTIKMKLNFKINQITGVSDSGPMISTNNLSTFISVRNGQSAAIGGLIRNSNYTDYNRLPADVSKNPIVSLFASKGFQRKQTQFVVFVTPIIKNSASEGAEKVKKKFRVRH